jgi:hypothetical protein
VLEHQRADHRQLELLMTHRIADPLLAAIKHVPATTAAREMQNALVQPLGSDKLTSLALMPRLPASFPHRALVRLPRHTTTLSSRRRRMTRRRHAAVPRVAVDLALKLLDPSLSRAGARLRGADRDAGRLSEQNEERGPRNCSFPEMRGHGAQVRLGALMPV